MLTQEEYMDLLALLRQGKTLVEIASEARLPPGHHLEVAAGRRTRRRREASTRPTPSSMRAGPPASTG